MSCNTKTSLAAVIDAVNAQLNNNYVDRDDPRINEGVFTNPTIRGGLMLDEAAKLDFCGYVTECGQREPFGKQWIDRPLYPDNTLVSYDDGGDIKSRWQNTNDVVAGTEIGESYLAFEETRSLGLQGYTIIDSFELGATITQRNQTLRHAATGKLYRWAGGLPKTVPAGSTPGNSGGVGTNAWLGVSDAALRQEILAGSLVTDALVKTVAPVGGISRNQKAKNDERLSVKDFGAKGDGLTDDTLAIRAAVEAAPEGATIYLPRGVYRTTGKITWRTKLSLKGDGIGASIIKMDGYNYDAIQHTSSGSTGGGDPLVMPLEDCHFEDFEIDGSGLTDTSSTPKGKGLFITYMKRAIFRNLYIHNTIGTGLGCDFLEETVIDSVVAEYCGRNFAEGGIGQSGIGIGTGWKEQESVRITNCHTNYNGNFGIFVEIQGGTQTYRAQGATFANCYAKGNLVGFSNKGSGGTNFLNCHATNNTEDGFRITSSRYSYNMIVGCRSEFNGNHGYYSNNTSAYDMISDSVAIGNALDGLYIISTGGQGETFPDGLGVNVSNLTSSDNAGCGIFIVPALATTQGSYTLKDCLVKNNGSTGLRLRNARDVVVSGGIFESNGDEGVSIAAILANGLVKIHDVVSRYNGSEGIIAICTTEGDFISIENSSVFNNCQSLTAGKRAGIAVESRSGEVVVKGNTSKNTGDGATQLEGIRLQMTNAISSAQITDNIINNNEVNPFSVGGLGEYIARRNVGYNYAEPVIVSVSESGAEQPKRNFDYNFYMSGTDISVSVNGALLVRDAITASVFVPTNATVVVTYTTKQTAYVQRL